jgi:hypothetical protein
MKTETMKNGLSIKQTILGLVGVLLLAVMAYVWVSQPTVEAKDAYQPISPAIQTELDTFEKNVDIQRCQIHKKIASAKLVDDMHGVKFESIDRNALAAKRDADCSF